MESVVCRTYVLLLALVSLSLSLPAQEAGHWIKGTKFTPLSEPAEEYWSATANGKFYLFGGSARRTENNVVLLPGRVIEYDPASDKFTLKKQMPRSANHMTVAESGGKIYVFGGIGSAHPGEGPANLYLDDSWEYDPASDSWKALAPMPDKRQAGAAASVGGKIYVIGGTGLLPGSPNPPGPSDTIVLATNEVYDPATNLWASRKAMPTPRNHEAIGTVGGKIYVIGGRIGAADVANLVSSGTDIVEEYDPATDRWRAMSKMPTARSGQGWGTYQGRIYVLGGELRDYHMDAIFRDMEAFDPAANEWFRLQPMPTARHGVNVTVIGNRLYAIGGHVAFDGTDEHNGDTAVDEVFDFGGH